MPFPNEHAARVRAPGGFDSIKRQNNKFGPGIHAMFGIIAGKSQLQAVRFDKTKFTPAEARRWMTEHDHKVILFEPATGKQKASRSMSKHKKQTHQSNSTGLLALYGVDSQPEPVSAMQNNDQGQPTRRYKKDIIHSGHYQHPKEEWELDVDQKRMDKWIDTFHKMKANGVDVEIVRDHSDKADDVLGYTVDVFREGDKLIAIPEMIGQESIDLAERVKNVSVLIDRDFTDGTGTHYGEAITHISIVQSPVVPGQEKFLPIAASRGGATNRIPYLYLGVKKMSTLLETLTELIGAGDALTDETAEGLVKSYFEGSAKVYDDLTAQVESLTADIKKLKAEADKVTEPAPNPVEMDEDTAEQAAEAADQRLSMLVQQGKITPAVQIKLSAVLLGETGKRNVMALSIKGQSSKKSLTTQILDALKDNDIIKLGEQTGAQVTLSRVTPDATAEAVDKDLQAEMTKTADFNSGT